MNGRVVAQDDSVENWRIAVVDRKEVFDNYAKQKDETAKLKAEVEKMQADLDKMSDKIQAAKDAYEADKEGMTEEQRDEAKKKIQQDFAEYQAQLKSMQAKVDSENALLIKNLKKDIDTAIAKYGEEKDYHLILEADPRSPTSVLYYKAAIDVTGDVVQRLNSGQ
jgi:Skp family chaperone for outer membrane proteins